jgi:phage-related protein
MKPGEFRVNNKSSLDIGAFIQSRPVLNTPKRRKKPRTISGRSGVLLFDEEAYDNTTMVLLGYSVGDEQNTAAMNRERLYNMFDSSSYVDVEFYFDPLKRYRVDLEEPLSFESRYYYGEGQAWTMTLSIKPFKYLINERAIEITENTTLHNPSNYNSEPEITIYGSGNINLIINDKEYVLKNVDDFIIVDSETKNAHKDYQNRNDRMYTIDFPIFEKINEISWTGDVEKLVIKPRWRWLV